MSVIEDALCRVANNVAKHLCNGKAWTVQDKCFRIDLREAEQELEALVAAQVEEGRAVNRKKAERLSRELRERTETLGRLLDLAREEEREACAKIADAAAERGWHGDGSRMSPEEIAQDIRARK